MTLSILLASPREPSGGSWLVNCLLELGIRVDLQPSVDRDWRGAGRHQQQIAMWQPAGDGGWRLHPRAEGLKKWFPILERQEVLHFTGAADVQYVQDLPRREWSAERTVLFVRDPRDSIYSLYRRNRPDLSLGEFARLPHHETLFDVIGQWRLFIECWLGRDDILVYRFEDYKADAVGLLTRIVRDLGLTVSPSDTATAAAESTVEKARAAEQRYRAAHPYDEQVAIRASKVGEWQTTPDALALASEIERRLGPLLLTLGYLVQDAPAAVPLTDDCSPFHFLTYFEQIDLPAERHGSLEFVDPMNCSRLPEILRFASTIDATLLTRARLHPQEARTLLDSLQEYAAAWHASLGGRLAAARSAFDDGSAYHLSRIREMMASRRLANKTQA